MRIQTTYDYLDRLRKLQGKALDAMGAKPKECTASLVTTSCSWSLLSYGGRSEGPVLLIIPAPIKRGYIWDLSPEISVVRLCLSAGIRVYRIEWKEPDLHGCGHGLDSYAGRFILECLDAIEMDSNVRNIFLAGHSLGGTLAAIFSSIYPERVIGLILGSAPTHFGPQAFKRATALSTMPPNSGRIPGSYLSEKSYQAYPITFGLERWMDFLKSAFDPLSLKTHILVMRWTYDELPMAECLFNDLLKRLYFENSFMKGNLWINGRRANPFGLSVPIFSIVEARSCVVPSQSMLPFHDTVRSTSKRVLWYRGDTGVALQHIGVLVGRTAIDQIWPDAIDWIKDVWKSCGSAAEARS